MTMPAAPKSSGSWIAIGLCLLAAMLEGFDIASMGVAAPKMLPDLGLSPGEAGTAFSASPFGLFVGALMAGPFADRVGRKPVLLWLFLPETKAKSAEDVLSGVSLHALFGRERLATTISLWLSFAAIALVLHLFLNWLPILLGQRGIAPRDTAGIMTLFNIGGALGGLFAGWAIDRMGARRPFLGIFLLLMLVLIVLSGLTGATSLSLFAFAAGFLIMAGQFGLYALAPQHYGEKVRGVGVGAAVSAGRLGSVFGPLVAGALLTGGATSGDVVMSTVPIVAVAGLAALALTKWGRKA